MRAVVQRVDRAQVTVEGRETGAIEQGLLVLIGIRHQDSEQDARFLAAKIINLRIFDGPGKGMDRSLIDVRGSLLVVSQFTLYGDCRKGRRPSWSRAADSERARELVEMFVSEARRLGVPVSTGEFGADMLVSLVNNGPVTLLLDTEKTI